MRARRWGLRMGDCRMRGSVSIGGGVRRCGYRGGYRSSDRNLKFFEARDDGGVFVLALVTVRLNCAQNGAEPVEQLEQPGDDGRGGGELALAQKAEKIFAGVGQLLQPLETEKARGALDGVYGAKDFREQRGIAGICLEHSEAMLHAVQAFLALDEELAG